MKRTTPSRKLQLLGAALAVALSAGAAWGKDQINVDLVNEPSSLDPHIQWNPDSYYVYRNVFDNLLTRNNDGDIIPQIATSWEQVSDNEVTFEIRDDVVFHDGEKLTADDIVFSVKRITDPDFGSPQLGQFNKIADVEKTGEHSVKMITDGPYPALMAQLVKLSIVPEHVVTKVGNEAFNLAPVGSGPYQFDGWDRGVSVTLKKNDNYWGDEGAFETAVFRAVPDAATRVANLRAGTADLVVSLDSDLAAQLAVADGVGIRNSPTERVGYLGINLDKPPFDKLEMRQALAAAIDREAIVEGILGGGERVVGQLASPAHFGWAEGIEPIPYDLEAARKITQADADYAATPATFATAPVFDQRIVQALQQMLNDAGFNVSISMTDMATYLALVRQEPAENSELSFGRWSCACQDADGITYPLLHSGSSWSRVNDTDLDKLLETSRSSLDPEKRQSAYADVHRIVKDNVYTLPLYQAAVLYGASDNLQFQPTANESMFLNRMGWAE